MSRFAAAASVAFCLFGSPLLQARPVRPPRPPQGNPRPGATVRFDPPYALWLPDGTQMVKESGPLRHPFAAEAEKITEDPRLTVYYSWSGRLPAGADQPVPPARGRRAEGGAYFLMTLTKNLKAATPFGALVRKRILTPQSKTGDQILCWQNPAGQWRGVVHGSGEVTGIRVAEFQRIIGGPAKRIRWAMVVGDINHGVWIVSNFSAVRNASVRRLCEANYPKVSSITCWWGADGKAKLFPFDAISSYHMLLLEDRTPKALPQPGAAPPPAAPAPLPVAKPDPPATPPPATSRPVVDGQAIWPFTTKMPAGFRLAGKVTAEDQDVWVLEGPADDGVRDVLLVIRTRPGAKPLLPITGAMWAAGSAAGYLPGETGLKAGKGGWARVTVQIEMRAGWRQAQTALGEGSPPSSRVTRKADPGHPAEQVKVSATEYRSNDSSLVVAGGTRANSAAYQAIGNKVDALARALARELSRPAKPPVTTPPEPKSKPSPERQAESQLRLANTYLKSGLPSRARDLLMRITKDYPNTKAATTAAELLKTLNNPK